MGIIVFVMVAIAFVTTVNADPYCPALDNNNPVGPNEEEIEINFIRVFTPERLAVAVDVKLSYTLPTEGLNNVANATVLVNALTKDAIKREGVNYSIMSYLNNAFIEAKLCPVVSSTLGSWQINLERFQVSQIHIPQRILEMLNRRN